MDLSCCICIFVLSHFAFGSSNEDEANEESTHKNKLSHKQSSANSDSVAIDVPDSSDKNAAETRGSQSLSVELSKYSGGSGGDLTVQSAQNVSETSSELGSEDISRDSSSSSGELMKLSGDKEALNHDKTMVYQWWNGIVPYYIDKESYDEIIVDRIDAATKIIEKESCIQFVLLDDKRKVHKYGKYFLHFTNPAKKRECVHTVTRGNMGEPKLVLGYDCMRQPDIIHALMHLLGFRDEVTHPLRDSYIRVLWENIQPKYRHLFTITKLPQYREMGEYDLMSIMHFHNRAYSINGAPTTVPLIPGGWISPSNQLSLMDKMKLRLAFRHECNRRKVSNLLGTCINSIQGDRTTGCSSGSETDRGASSGNTGASSGNTGASSGKDRSGGSSGSEKYVKIIDSGEVKKESLIGTDHDKIEALSGTDTDKIEALSATDKDKIEALSGTNKDKIEALSETNKDKIEALSGTDKDKIEALSGTNKDKIEALKGTDKDKRGDISRGGTNKIGGSNHFKKDKQSLTWTMHSYRKRMY